jgi:eukaryotic-like serine/threonine-protein kinase
MITIKLSKTWLVEDDKPLGSPGGFGSVFCGKGEEGQEATIKLFHLERVESASRELSLAKYLSTSACPHVIPILDSGPDEYTGAYVIVMARATRNLQELINDQAPLQETDALEILDAIAQGLQEIGGIVHRDLKPANILEHNHVWKIADLGLARFLDASTSAHTMKGFLSAPYAAPELWRGERAVKASDVYSLGCISYALLTGHPPFDGPERDDYRRQHELSTPPELPASARLKQLTSRSLAKAPDLRPPVDSYRIQLANIRSPKPILQTTGLARAAAALAAKRAQEEAEELRAKQKREERRRISQEATSQATEMLRGLVDLIRADVPDATLNKSNAHYLGSEKLELVLQLGEAILACDIVNPSVEEGAFGKSWDLYSLAKVEVVSKWSSQGGQSANLAFGRIGAESPVAWWELGFTFGSVEPFDLHRNLDRNRHPHAPFSLGEGNSWSGHRWGADGTAIRYGWYKLAYNPKRIDGEHLESFYQRWIDLFSRMAVARSGDLGEAKVPEEPVDPQYQFSW